MCKGTALERRHATQLSSVAKSSSRFAAQGLSLRALWQVESRRCHILARRDERVKTNSLPKGLDHLPTAACTTRTLTPQQLYANTHTVLNPHSAKGMLCTRSVHALLASFDRRNPS